MRPVQLAEPTSSEVVTRPAPPCAAHHLPIGVLQDSRHITNTQGSIQLILLEFSIRH